MSCSFIFINTSTLPPYMLDSFYRFTFKHGDDYSFFKTINLFNRREKPSGV